MDRDKKLYYMGYEHGISDQCNKKTNLSDNINAIENHPCKKVYPPEYLVGYRAGYEEAKGKHWYITKFNGGRVVAYYNDGQWVDGKDQAKKYNTRAELEAVVKRIPQFKQGSCGMRFE